MLVAQLAGKKSDLIETAWMPFYKTGKNNFQGTCIVMQPFDLKNQFCHVPHYNQASMSFLISI